MIVADFLAKLGFRVDDRGLKDFRSSLRREMAETQAQLRGIRNVGIAVGAGLASAAAGIGGILKIAGEFEQSEVAFETLIGNTELAHKTLRDLQDFAAKTPFTIQGVQTSARQLLAVGVGTDKLIPTLKALGDVSAGLSVPMERLVLNFGQVLAQGKLTGRELRDFAVAGVPIREVLAKNLGVTTAEVGDLVSAGKVGFKEVEQAFISMTSEGGRFFDLMIKQSKTLGGLISNLQDFFTILAADIGKQILPEAKAYIRVFLEMINANRQLIKTRVVEFIRATIDVIKEIAFWMVSAGRAVMRMVDAIGGLRNLFIILGLIWAALNINALLFLAAILAIFLIVDDLIVAFQGGDALTSGLVDPLKEAWMWATNLVTPLIDAWKWGMKAVGAFLQMKEMSLLLLPLLGLFEAIKTAIEFSALFIEVLWSGIAKIINGVTSMIGGSSFISSLTSAIGIGPTSELPTPAALLGFGGGGSSATTIAPIINVRPRPGEDEGAAGARVAAQAVRDLERNTETADVQ
jgi:tape measure domain-containing protein